MRQPDAQFTCPDRIVRIGRFGHVFAGVYQTGLTARVLDDVRAWQRTVMPTVPIASFSLSFAAQRLQPDVREAADRLLAEFREQTAASATVMRMHGFEGSAARAMLSTIYLLTRAAYPRKVFSTVAEAKDWLLTTHTDSESILAATQWLTQYDTPASPSGPDASP